MFRASRSRPAGEDPFLDIRIGLFVIGAVLGLTGMIRGSTITISFGILALGIGMLLGLIGRRRASPSDTEDAKD